MMSINQRILAVGPGAFDPAAHSPDRAAVAVESPDFTSLELEEIVGRIGRGVRAMVSDSLIDPVPREFQRLLDVLEKTEKPGGA
jgi:hypothetical protein